MHELQKKLLRLAQEENLGKYTLRALGAMVGEKSPQKIKHHLGQLEKLGLIRIDRGNSLIERTKQGWVTSMLKGAQLLSIPILGAANAGPANRLAEAHIEGYLRISSTFLGSSSKRKLFALKVDGPSMNRAEVDGRRIENGDYVIIDSEARNPKDGDVVLSIIDGMANLKRYHADKANKQVVLISDSTQRFPPIYIHADDDFMINGKVIQVIKKPISK
ncbi:MAG TPA: S24 family peptidase [Pyrinomonadaceae bacterium]